MGESPESFAVLFDSLGATAIGINCASPDTLLCALEKMRHCTNVPLLAKPNAGRVRIVGNTVKQTLNSSTLASYCERFIRAGARIIGGCCGTDPDYIKKIKDHCAAGSEPRGKIRKQFVLCSPRAPVCFEDGKVYIVGERLNPSGRKALRESIEQHDFQIYGAEAAAQEGTGAAALDVNAFIAGGNETENLQEAVYSVSAASSLPLFIDTQDYAAARAVISRYPGIGVYNSVPAREKELRLWLPMLRYYGFKVVISLIGIAIPKNHSERMENVRLALKIAQQTGFDRKDMIFDPLVFSLATDPAQVKHTLQTVQALSRRKLKTILGISNISFGLPRRHWLNAVMAHEAIRNGIDFLILNTENESVMNTVVAAQALLDGNAVKYINAMPRLADVTESIIRERPVARQTVGKTAAIITDRSLITAVVEGDGTESVRQVKDLIKRGVKPKMIIDEHVIKALQTVGDRYEKGMFFVPDLLRSADAAKRALDVLKASLPKKMSDRTIILATVKGDIHDIGKNIAAMVFESAGYKIIDLGKDVTVNRIIGAVRKHRPCALGLSALLTTTMPEMARVIEELRRNKLNVKVIIGGPNVSDSYARQIGAFGAARSALAGLKIIQKIQKIQKAMKG
jgi:5-methyltetrahydrofolate--homocysteine methyltransferase